MTGRDLVTASLRLIGALAPGQSLEAAEAVDGLESINRMIDSWSNEELLIYSKVREQLALTPSDGIYTIGPTGNINTTRPMRIDEALIRVETSSPAIEYPLNVVSLAEWASITAKDSTSEIPTDIYIEGTYPLETVNLYPVPTTAHKLIIFSWKPLTQIATLDTEISLPPGYERALVYNGALELSSEYGRQVSEIVFNIANDSKAAIKRMNHKPSYLRVDNALVSGGSFNIMTGDFR